MDSTTDTSIIESLRRSVACPGRCKSSAIFESKINQKQIKHKSNQKHKNKKNCCLRQKMETAKFEQTVLKGSVHVEKVCEIVSEMLNDEETTDLISEDKRDLLQKFIESLRSSSSEKLL
jgi:hypothetical protein